MMRMRKDVHRGASKTILSETSEQSGFVFVFLAITLTAILAAMGMAIDSATLYLDSMRKQRAADAGAVAATFHILNVQSLPFDERGPAIEKVALDVSEDNLRLNHIAFDAAHPEQHFAASYNPNDLGVMSVNVEVAGEQNTLVFGNWLPGKNTWTVAEQAKGIRRPVAVTLVLDVSFSMTYPASPGCASCGNKLDALKVAAKGFIGKLDPAIDRLSIVSYSTNSQILYPEVPEDRDAIDIAKANSIIDGLTPVLYTNIHHALWNASVEATDPSIPSNALRAVILVTDGAPNRSLRNGEIPAYNPVTRYDYHPGSCADLEAGLRDRSNNEKREDYLLAIMEADRLRAQGVMLFTVGVGEKATNNSDAYQDASNDGVLKTTFLNRIANDAAQGEEDAHAFPCVPGYEELSEAPAGSQLNSPDANDLPQMLFSIIRRVQARLVV